MLKVFWKGWETLFYKKGFPNLIALKALWYCAFRNGFTTAKQPVIALLHPFKGTVNVDMMW